MATSTASAKSFAPKLAAKSILDNASFNSVSVWVLLLNGKEAGKVAWTIGNGGTWKCSIIMHYQGRLIFTDNDVESFNALVIGSASGYGYDKRSAAFADCLYRNGVDREEAGPLSGRGANTVVEYLESKGFQVIQAI